MVDQTPINGSAKRAEPPSRAVARSTGELLEDLLTLAELQFKLLVLDLQQGVWRLAVPAAAVVAGSLVALGCIPVALAAAALCLDEATSLSVAQAFGLSLLGGVVFAGILAGSGWTYLRYRLDIFERTRTEWQQNSQWVRTALKRFGKPTVRREPVNDPSSNPR